MKTILNVMTSVLAGLDSIGQNYLDKGDDLDGDHTEAEIDGYTVDFAFDYERGEWTGATELVDVAEDFDITRIVEVITTALGVAPSVTSRTHVWELKKGLVILVNPDLRIEYFIR